MASPADATQGMGSVCETLKFPDSIVTSIREPPIRSVEVISPAVAENQGNNNTTEHNPRYLDQSSGGVVRTMGRVQAIQANQPGLALRQAGLRQRRSADEVAHNGVDRYFARTKYQDDERRNEKRIGGRGVELVGIGEDRQERFAIRGDVSHDHVHGEDQSRQTREQAERQKNSAKKLHAGNKDCGLRGKR